MNVSHFDMGGLTYSFRNYIDEGGSIGDIYVNSVKKRRKRICICESEYLEHDGGQ